MITTKQVQRLLNKYDFQGLLRMGADSDEYDAEATCIIEELGRKRKPVSQQTVLNLTYKVFKDMFTESLAGKKSTYESFAKDLHSKLKQ